MNGAIFDEASKRGVVVFMIVLISAFASNLLIVDLSMREVIGMSLVPAIGAFASRAGYETFIDTRRAAAGRMLPSDVPVVSNAVTVTENAKPAAGDPVLSEAPKA